MTRESRLLEKEIPYIYSKPFLFRVHVSYDVWCLWGKQVKQHIRGAHVYLCHIVPTCTYNLWHSPSTGPVWIMFYLIMFTSLLNVLEFQRLPPKQSFQFIDGLGLASKSQLMQSKILQSIWCDHMCFPFCFISRWFQIFFISTPIWGRFPFWLIFFRWVETTNQIYIYIYIQLIQDVDVKLSPFCTSTPGSSAEVKDVAIKAVTAPWCASCIPLGRVPSKKNGNLRL